MSEITQEEISHLADLTRLELSQAEKEQFAAQLPAIVEFVEQLQTMKIGDNLPAEKQVELSSLRPDEVSNQERLTIEQLKKLAPNWDKTTNQLEVPAVFGESDDE